MTGKKYDKGKSPVVSGFMSYFPRAILAVADVSAYGLNKYKLKYEDLNWSKVDNAMSRYADAEARHQLARFIEGEVDSESNKLHLAHKAWNALATLELLLKEKEDGSSN